MQAVLAYPGTSVHRGQKCRLSEVWVYFFSHIILKRFQLLLFLICMNQENIWWRFLEKSENFVTCIGFEKLDLFGNIRRLFTYWLCTFYSIRAYINVYVSSLHLWRWWQHMQDLGICSIHHVHYSMHCAKDVYSYFRFNKRHEHLSNLQHSLGAWEAWEFWKKLALGVRLLCFRTMVNLESCF